MVAGVRTPQSITKLQEDMPSVYQELVKITDLLEKHYQDMQDVEFTVEKGKLYMLQTRSGKRTAKAAIKIAVDLVKAGLISQEEAIQRIEPSQLDQLLHPTFSPKALDKSPVLAKGLPASPGAASGRVYFNAEDVVANSKGGAQAILVRQETSPEDIEGMISAVGILTARGGMTSHAAVVARGMGKPCVAGCSQLRVNELTKTIEIGDLSIKEGDYLSFDGATGAVYLGQLEMTGAQADTDYQELMTWVDQKRQLMVRANADNPRDAQKAIDFGAQGIGLCRTEHMFFEEERIPAVRKMILADNLEDRMEALAQLLPFQRDDFYQLFKVLDGKSCNIRLLDPPLHEFLPHEEQAVEQLANQLSVTVAALKRRISDLAEFNPMLGHRGCRLALTYPEIYQMQVRAIKGAIMAQKEGYRVAPEIMVPLVSTVHELRFLRQLIDECVKEELTKEGIKMAYSVGTMIETPRACVTAD
ncbi:pyruvate, phosphate dikinase [Streptococcus ictaluri 707-05]|uniref:Pyruvate, phosphate dikinase n=1 Tax=Streptococcus ictaluri 707-05 TaxID=764299 RepID=G5K013_9STRE|nr:pyruvate, phosphate dikinase [Streptococcus ictaluri 707-05]